MDQLALPFKRDEEGLKDFLEKASGRAVSLAITNNSTSLLSIKSEPGKVSVRLHRIFLHAGEDVIGEIAALMKKQKIKTPLIRDFIRYSSGSIKESTVKKRASRTQGKYFNLAEIYDLIHTKYFRDGVSAAITWGTRCTRHSVKKRTLGSYNDHSNTIRISPVLDKKTVPRYFIEFIVYHEMLHADMGVEVKKGRRGIHTKEFRRRERLFLLYEKAAAWEKENI
jgi:predicted metal-dependent hydrolase